MVWIEQQICLCKSGKPLASSGAKVQFHRMDPLLKTYKAA